MKFDMVKPCDNCPFRQDGAGIPLSAARAKEITRSITQRQESFPCHKTVDYSNETEGDTTGPNVQHCAGALIALEDVGRPNQMMRIMERLGAYNRRRLDRSIPCGIPKGGL